MQIAHAASVLVIVIGLSVLASWVFEYHPLMAVLPGFAAMKPNTAAGLCCAGLSLFLFTLPGSAKNARARRLSMALAGAASLLGALTLGEYATGFHLGIDELLARDDAGHRAGASTPGRMPPITAFNFVCLGLALVFLRFPKRTPLAHALTGCVALTSLLAIVGYFYGATSLYQSGNFTAVALHTAIAFLVLCAGVWFATSHYGLVAVVTAPGASGMLVRRYGAAAVVFPFLFGWLRLQGEGWFGIEFGVAIVATANALTFATLIWIGAASLRAAERQQARAQESLRESEERLHLVVDNLTEGLVISDVEGRLLHWNRAGLKIHGYATLEEGLLSMPQFSRTFELATLEGKVLTLEEWPLARILRGEELRGFEARVRRLDRDWERVVSYGGSVLREASGRPLAYVTITDVTRQKDAEALAEKARESLLQAHQDLEQRVLQRTSELAAANAGLQELTLECARVEHDNQQILDNSLDVLCTFDAEGRFLQVSRACEVLWGYPPEELIGRPYLELVHPEDQGKTIAAAGSVMEGSPENDFENRYLRRDGSAVPVVWTATWSKGHQIMFCVARDMTARKQMERELLRARDVAEAASRSKSEFLANMSHEIRTPMNGIIGMTELVLETELAPGQREYLGMARSSALSLLGLINDILDFSKIEAGKLELEAISFSLRDCLRALLKPLGLRADQKELELTADIPAEVPDHVVGDPLRLRQILTNLIDNAIKFTERGDVMLQVAVESATEAGHCLHFAVRDTGIGIPAAKQALIFEAFAQADGTTTRTYGGTGLGLAIASPLAQQMGGRMWVESTVDEGTTFHFTVRLPVRQTPAPDAPHADPRRLEGLRVLVVDDNAVNCRILHEMLASWRMQPSVVTSGEAALVELLRAAQAGAPFPLVLLDGMMPEMDGFMVARKIREHAELSGATVMMLSSAMPSGVAERCAEVGVASYLTKPVCQCELLAAILVALGGTAEREPAAEAAAIVPAGSGLRILLAEDNVINRAVAAGILEKRGHSLVHAANGREAVEAAGREAFDLILMDVQMPELDGLEATHRIRESEQLSGRHTPIAAMTAHAMAGDRERCLAAGMNDYLSKPLQKAALLALLERVRDIGFQPVRPARDTGFQPVRPAAFQPLAEPERALEAHRPHRPEAGVALSSRAELLAEMDDDEALLQRMIALFHSNTPRLLDAIRDAAHRRHADDLARGAHALLSSFGAFGAKDGHRLALQIEKLGRRSDFDHVGQTFSELERETARIDAALHALSAALPGDLRN